MTAGRLTAEDGDAQWYALRVQVQKEYTVAYILRQLGVRTFTPTDLKFRRRTRYTKSKAEYANPVIPGCIFAGFDGSPLWYNVMRNHLIVGPEGMDGHPWRLDIGKIYKFFASQIDGCLVLDGGQRLVYAQGAGANRFVRAPTTQTRVISKRHVEEPAPTVEPQGRRARLLSQFVIPERAVLMAA